MEAMQMKFQSCLDKNLKRLMKENALSMRTLSQKVDLPVSTIHGWLHGAAPKSIMDLKRVAHYFHLSVDELCFNDDLNGRYIDPEISLQLKGIEYRLLIKKV